MVVLKRRRFISLTIGGILVGLKPVLSMEKLVLTETEWKEKLTEEAYYILRQSGTERPFSSVLNNEKREGVYECAGCNLPLFNSSMKFDSGTGWPSFTEALPGAFKTKVDYSFGMKRIEYHCAKCGAHHGHVFEDGPGSTGKRYCNNGLCLIFKPSS